MEENIPMSCRPVKSKYYTWSAATVGRILHNPFYKGAHVVCKTHQKGIRSGTYDKIPRDEWEIIEDCHEAIVTKEEWDMAQQLIASRPKVSDGKKVSPFESVFSGLLHCADCGKAFTPRYEKHGRTDIDRTTKKPRDAMDKSFYVCTTYVKLGKSYCTSHKLEARSLYELVLRDIRCHAQQAVSDSEIFYERIARRLEKSRTADETALKREMEKLNGRNEEIDAMFMNLYADKTKGILSEQRFILMSQQLDEEQTQNSERLQQLRTELSAQINRAGQISEFIEDIKACASIDALTDELVHRLISDIIVGEVKEIDGEKVQTIRIIYNFVGDISTETSEQYADGNYNKKTVRIEPAA